jgi:hypothetical protein
MPIDQAIQTIAVKLAAAHSSAHRSCHSAFSGQSVSIEVKIMTLIFCGTNRLSLVPFLLETVLPHPLDTPVQTFRPFVFEAVKVGPNNFEISGSQTVGFQPNEVSFFKVEEVMDGAESTDITFYTDDYVDP